MLYHRCIFNFALRYAITKIQAHKEGLKLSGIYELLTFANDVYLFGENKHTTKKNVEALIDTSKELF
jgi:hypothetical protein